MILIDSLREIIKEGYIHKPKKNNGVFILTEDSKEVKCKEVKIKTSSDNYIIFKFDQNVKNIKDRFPFFKDKIKRLRVINDYIMIYYYNKKYYVLTINLKSNDLGNNADQLLAGEIFARYLIDSAVRVKDINIFPYEIQFVVPILYSKKILIKSPLNYKLYKNSYYKILNYTNDEISDIDYICNSCSKSR